MHNFASVFQQMPSYGALIETKPRPFCDLSYVYCFSLKVLAFSLDLLQVNFLFIILIFLQ